jgi:dolichol-phosphate mannosyltransferase
LELSVVIPFHNEAGNVEALVAGVAAELDGWRWELLAVDDASDDGTADVLCALRHSVSELRILRHQARRGQSASIATGVRAARARTIVTLDGDGQNDPRDILPLVAALHGHVENNVQLVIGHRQERRDTRWRRISSRIANAVRGWLLRDRTPDSGCGLKVFPRDAFLALPCFDHMHRFMPALFRNAGGDVVSLAVRHHPRTHGRSHYGTLGRLIAGIVDLLGVLWLMKRSGLTEAIEIDQGGATLTNAARDDERVAA